MLAQMSEVRPVSDENQKKFTLDRIVQTGDWGSILKYIGAMYSRPENGKYVRITSGLASDLYFNMGTSEVDYQILDRASRELARKIQEAHIVPTTILGAQM